MTENEIGTETVDAAAAIHRSFGPGLLESGYEAVRAKKLAALCGRLPPVGRLAS